jgi:hypothetical protein
MSDLLERFHRVLVEEVRAHRPDAVERPFTVAEIYQNLVPYGTHRDRIGVAMNGDYEHTLLRLLAGEGGYLLLESEHAVSELRRELDSPNPNTGLYREFAALDVRLDPDRAAVMQGGGEEGGVEPAAEGDAERLEGGSGPAVDVGALAPVSGEPDADADRDSGAGPMEAAGLQATFAEEAAQASGAEEGPAAFWSTPAEGGAAGAGPLAPPETADAPDEGPGDGGERDTCLWCRAQLPDRPNLNFCPFCGTDVRLVPCPACGEELQPGWRFCIACGGEVEA